MGVQEFEQMVSWQQLKTGRCFGEFANCQGDAKSGGSFCHGADGQTLRQVSSLVWWFGDPQVDYSSRVVLNLGSSGAIKNTVLISSYQWNLSCH